MKIVSFIVFVGAVGCAISLAHGQAAPPPTPAGYVQSVTGNGNLGSGLIFSSGTLTYVGPTATPYGSGNYPHLQAALADLLQAQTNLVNANPSIKSDNLPRAVTGVQIAIDDVKREIDSNDGKSAGLGASLPALPPGVGNANWPEMVVPTAFIRVGTPNLARAISFATDALNELKTKDSGDKAQFMSRVMADVMFVVDNTNAAINVANGEPATQPKPPGVTPTPASIVAATAESTSTSSVNGADLAGPLLLLTAMVLLGAVQLVRNRGHG